MSDKLLAGARAGTLVDLGEGTDHDALSGDPNWGTPRQLAADLLLGILTGRTDLSTADHAEPGPHPRGVRIRGARIVGEMSWEWQQLIVPLELLDCVIDHRITLDHTQLAGLTLTRCRLPGLSGEQLTSASTLQLVGSQIGGTVILRDASISGAVLASGAVVAGAGDPHGDHGEHIAVIATRIQITGALLLDDGFRAQGAVVLAGARIGGNLLCGAGHFDNLGGDSLRATDADIAGSVDLGDGFESLGSVTFSRTRIGGNLGCDGGSFSKPGLDALIANRVDIGGGLFLRRGFTATGRVRLLGARVGGNWDCTDGIFHNPDGHSLWADGAQIAGNVSFRGKFSATGRIQLADAEIGGSLECDGGTFRAPAGQAFRAVNLRVGGDVLLGRTPTGETVNVFGEFTLSGARVSGSLNCDGARFSHAEDIAVNLSNSEIQRNVRFNEGFHAEGRLRLTGIRIGGMLDCGGGTFTNPDGITLHAVDAQIGDSVFLSPDFTSVGEVSLSRARIGGTLDCGGGRFSNPNGHALFARGMKVGAEARLNNGFSADGAVRLVWVQISADLDCRGGFFGGPQATFAAEGMTVTGSFRWREITTPIVGMLDLRRAQVGELDDDATSWPAQDGLRLAGFSYQRLSDRAPRSPRARVDWIRRQRGYNPEPYQQLAAVYRSRGQVSEATAVAIAQQDDLLARGDLTGPAKAWAWFLGRSIGHGYRPSRAAWALLVLYLVTLASVWLGARADAFIQVGNTAPQSSVSASHCGDAYPCLSAPAYALENITPILNLHQAENWHPKSSTPTEWLLRDWLYLSTVVGYAGTTLLAAALSGLARRA